MERKKFSYYKPVKPTNKEIFYALTSEESNPDWDIEILEKVDPEDRKRVVEVLQKGLPFSEAEIEVENLVEGR